MTPAIQELAAKLGISEQQLSRLEHRYVRKHGDDSDAKLERQLGKLWRECRDEPRIPAKQNGRAHPEQYTNHAADGLPDEPESVSMEVQAEQTAQSRQREVEGYAQQRVKLQGAIEGLKGNPQVAQHRSTLRYLEHAAKKLDRRMMPAPAAGTLPESKERAA